MQVKYKITLAPKFKAFQQRYFKLNAGHRHERTIFYRITYGKLAHGQGQHWRNKYESDPC